MYIPKNRIITNQYSNDSSLVVKSTGKFYKGFYYKTFDGKYFSGKTPNDPPNVELEVVQPLDENISQTLPQNKIAYSDLAIPPPGYNEDTVIKYANINNINLNKPNLRFVPIQFYPTPTEDDYKLGVFTRYFCVKINENRYLELSKDVYDKLVNKNSNYLWEPYIPFKLQWTIAGELDYVVNTNRNIILLTEKRLKRKGLDIFLRRNYGKFWNSEQ
jgi:hypothetical protein